MEKQTRILIVGTLPPPICGTTVSLHHLVEDIRQRRDDCSIEVVDTSGIRGRGVVGLWRLVVSLGRLVSGTWRNQVVALHLNPFAVPLLGPLAVILCRVFRRKLVVRIFGGNCFTEFEGLRGRIFGWVLGRSDLYLVQAKKLVQVAVEHGIPNVKWFPTSRPRIPGLKPVRQTCRRFVFVGWVCPAKGIPTLLDAAERVSDLEFQVDVYGPFRDGCTANDFANSSRVKYCGVIPTGEAMRTIAQYDALVLPTSWVGEGYPGVILEAFQVGIPVIASRWRFIPELVTNETGILIQPNDAASLADAMSRICQDDDYYLDLQHGARKRASEFALDVWTDNFLDYCKSA